MDTELAGALGTVWLDARGAEQLFGSFRTVYAELVESGDEENWPLFWERFGVAAGHLVDADQFARFGAYLAERGQMTLVGSLAELGDDLVPTYFAVCAPVENDAAAGPGELWAMLVERHGADWAGFTGTEQSWVDYRDWFYANANSIDPDAYALAYQQLSPLDGYPMDYRIQVLRSYGFAITDPVPAPEPVPDDSPSSDDDILRQLEEGTLAAIREAEQGTS